MKDPYTPGRWYLDRDDIESHYSILAPAEDGVGKRLIAYVMFGFLEPAESEQHANAKLIAEAKSLAQALRDVLSLSGDQLMLLGRAIGRGETFEQQETEGRLPLAIINARETLKRIGAAAARTAPDSHDDA